MANFVNVNQLGVGCICIRDYVNEMLMCWWSSTDLTLPDFVIRKSYWQECHTRTLLRVREGRQLHV